MSFCVCRPYVALCNNERVVIYNLDSGKENVVMLPHLEDDKKIDLHNNVDIEAFHMITSITFSLDGNYFLVCTNRKQLCLYNTKTLTLLSNRRLVRAASKARFVPNNDIVVADKAGDAYIYSTSNPAEKGTLIVGHLSMLLDVIITNDEKYIVTADRDEKIRVSMMPNSYNIVSYCLGHTKFVTNISELPHDRLILVSAGGDGIFILWDYRIGKELLSINYSEKIQKEDIDQFNKGLKEWYTDEIVEVLPVKHMKLSILDKTSSLMVLSFYHSKVLLVYNIRGTLQTEREAVYLKSITVESEPLECFLEDHNLWVLFNSGLKVYEFQDNTLVLQEKPKYLESLNAYWETLKNNSINQNIFPMLYKRKYDNVQEYLERKKLRTSNT